jgi:hypothetical protein
VDNVSDLVSYQLSYNINQFIVLYNLMLIHGTYITVGNLFVLKKEKEKLRAGPSDLKVMKNRETLLFPILPVQKGFSLMSTSLCYPLSFDPGSVVDGNHLLLRSDDVVRCNHVPFVALLHLETSLCNQWTR